MDRAFVDPATGNTSCLWDAPAVGDVEALFEKAGIAHEPFVAREKDWYDESIRAMDAEIARLFERLEELGRAENTLVVFTSDHGEEFLEHGRHFHGNNAYGEMTNVPLFFWGPRWVSGGVVANETVQSIDVYPTVLELCGLPPVGGIQGQSLVPLIESTPGFVEVFRQLLHHAGTGEQVEIGIYNVSGRLVRKLVSGQQSPGYHEVTWDARGDNGVQVSPGVYFLKAIVGTERIKGSRILYMR